MSSAAILSPHHAAGLGRQAEPVVVLETRVVRGSGGGPDKTILNSPKYLWSAGYQTLCAYMHPPGDLGFEVLKRRAAACHAPLLSVPDRGPLDYRVVRQLIQLCRQENVAVWHGHDYKSNALGLVVRRFWPMRLVTTVHGWMRHTWRRKLYCQVDEWCLPRYEAVICVSDDQVERCRAIGVPGRRVHFIENAIEPEDYRRRTTATTAKQQLNIPAGRSTVGAVGRLSPEKGFDGLVRAAAALVRGGVDLELVIAGSGECESQLKSLAAELGVADRVRLLGHIADPRPVYEALDVYVLSSHSEGLPNVVLEAMAMEVPVVATRINGVPRVVRDGENGRVVEPRSADALTAAIGALLADPAERARLARAGRQAVLGRYSFADRMQKVRTVYDGLLGRG